MSRLIYLLAYVGADLEIGFRGATSSLFLGA